MPGTCSARGRSRDRRRLRRYSRAVAPAAHRARAMSSASRLRAAPARMASPLAVQTAGSGALSTPPTPPLPLGAWRSRWMNSVARRDLSAPTGPATRARGQLCSRSPTTRPIPTVTPASFDSQRRHRREWSWSYWLRNSSCSDHCGGTAPSGCSCSASCVSAGNCCSDYEDICHAFGRAGSDGGGSNDGAVRAIMTCVPMRWDCRSKGTEVVEKNFAPSPYPSVLPSWQGILNQKQLPTFSLLENPICPSMRDTRR